MLTKEQMKKISGGNFNCSYSGTGPSPYGPLGCDTSTGITACGCQDIFDEICDTNQNCTDIDCGCK